MFPRLDTLQVAACKVQKSYKQSRRQLSSNMSSPPLTLDGLARFVAALSTGALPTQRQLSAFLSALIESPLLNTDSEEQQRGLNQQGREIVAAARDAVEAFRELGDDKNGILRACGIRARA